MFMVVYIYRSFVFCIFVIGVSLFCKCLENNDKLINSRPGVNYFEEQSISITNTMDKRTR